jgi:hypothetical protein
MLFSIVAATTSVAQDQRVKWRAGAGHSFLGTGDISGYTFFNEVELRLKKRFTVNSGIQFTNHAGSYEFTDHAYRYAVSGITGYINVNYLLLLKPRHRIAIGVGPSLRYQNSSDPYSIGVRREPTGMYILEIDYRNPRSTWALGYVVAPQYEFQISRRCFLGARFMLQNDTEGDLLASQALTFAVGL